MAALQFKTDWVMNIYLYWLNSLHLNSQNQGAILYTISQQTTTCTYSPFNQTHHTTFKHYSIAYYAVSIQMYMPQYSIEN